MNKSLSVSHLSDFVYFKVLPHISGGYIGEIILDRPNALNAKNIGINRALCDVLKHWANCAEILAVIIRSNVSKAFCAGGDVVSLFNVLKHHDYTNIDSSSSIFTEEHICYQTFYHEYKQDYILYRYPKPVFCIANGFTLGGGFGTFSAAKYKIATESARFAMPESAIGLYPDAGATFFLNKLSPEIRRFLSFTGYMMNANEAHSYNLADTIIKDTEVDSFIKRLTHCSFTESAIENLFRYSVSKSKGLDNQLLHAQCFLEKFFSLDALPHWLYNHKNRVEFVENIFCYIQKIVENLPAGQKPDDSFLDKMKKSLTRASFASLYITDQQLNMDRLKIVDALNWEFKTTLIMMHLIDFKVGVQRALVDKTSNYVWHYQSYNEAKNAFMDVEKHCVLNDVF